MFPILVGVLVPNDFNYKKKHNNDQYEIVGK